MTIATCFLNDYKLLTWQEIPHYSYTVGTLLGFNNASTQEGYRVQS